MLFKFLLAYYSVGEFVVFGENIELLVHWHTLLLEGGELMVLAPPSVFLIFFRLTSSFVAGLGQP
jgi:hypothetical protein